MAVNAASDMEGVIRLDLWSTYPDLPEAIFDGHVLRPYVRMMINVRDIEFVVGLDTAVSETGHLAIFPPIAGG